MQTETDALWVSLRDRMLIEHPDITRGKMMSADALTFQGKVFAFRSTKGGGDGLGCRLGRAFDPGTRGVAVWYNLAPFKTRPPMRDWFLFGIDEQPHWLDMAQTALSLMRKTARSGSE